MKVSPRLNYFVTVFIYSKNSNKINLNMLKNGKTCIAARYGYRWCCGNVKKFSLSTFTETVSFPFIPWPTCHCQQTQMNFYPIFYTYTPMWVEFRTRGSYIMQLGVTDLSENCCRTYARTMKPCDSRNKGSLVQMLVFPHVLHNS
jgi:hypothetical protein